MTQMNFDSKSFIFIEIEVVMKIDLFFKTKSGGLKNPHFPYVLFDE